MPEYVRTFVSFGTVPYTVVLPCGLSYYNIVLAAASAPPSLTAGRLPPVWRPADRPSDHDHDDVDGGNVDDEDDD